MAKIAELEARQALNALQKWAATLLAERQADVGVVPLDAIYSDAACKLGSLLEHALERIVNAHQEDLKQAGYVDVKVWKVEVLHQLFGGVVGDVPEIQ